MKYLITNAKKHFFLTLSVVLVTTTLTFAQGDTGDDPDFPDVPLDGGLSVLLIAGAAYGAKKTVDYRRKNK